MNCLSVVVDKESNLLTRFVPSGYVRSKELLQVAFKVCVIKTLPGHCCEFG